MMSVAVVENQHTSRTRIRVHERYLVLCQSKADTTDENLQQSQTKTGKTFLI
jgi:hypothetical protein